MLGSISDAEDALQDTLLAAWQGIASFEGRSSIRTWLYRIATNRCLNARRAAARRPAKEWDVPRVDPPEPTRLGEVAWLEPIPDALLEGVIDQPTDPAARYEQRESISLAFVTALQLLPPRQVAVLVLRDVLGYPASEAAARPTPPSIGHECPQACAGHPAAPDAAERAAASPGSPAEAALAAQFADAYESADLAGLIALLTDDVFISMPPMPFEYEGREPAERFFGAIFDAGRRFDLVPTWANGPPAFGAYLRDAGGARHGVGLFVLTLAGDHIRALTRFENTVLPWFGLPRQLSER